MDFSKQYTETNRYLFHHRIPSLLYIFREDEFDNKICLIDGMASNCSKLFLVILKSFFFVICLGVVIEASNESLNIGAIIDVDTRVGKEQKTAMIIATENFNNLSSNRKLTIHFREIRDDPIQAVLSAEELIREDHVQVIIGLQTWEQATMVADVGRRAHVPVLSLTAAYAAPKVMQLRWPFLIPLPSNSSEQMNCIAAMVQSHGWRKVIVIYEENAYGSDSGMLAQLSSALQIVDTEVQSYLALPPPSSLFDSERVVREEVAKLLRRQSRVFIILRASLPLANHLFKEAKLIGLMGRDSVWIIADTLSDLLDSVGTSFVNSAQGALGIKKYYSEETRPYLDFKRQFQKNFRLKYPDEENLEPGIHSLQAYDGITAIYKAMENLGGKSTNISVLLLSKILASNFTGLTGGIHFRREEVSDTSIFRVINIVGKSYKELGFWSSSFGFLDKLEFENGKMKLGAINGVQNMEKLNVVVNWPGELKRTPRGWAMPTETKPMKIGVPGRTSFEKFVKIDWANKLSNEKYDGFCIDLFEKVLEIVQEDYILPYEFFPYNGSYDDLVDHVINKTYDAVVGDITILANRSRYVEFTQPFAESGLSMLVPVKHESQFQQAWMFLKPFTPNLWSATYAILFYTMFVIWFIEHNSDNKQFGGPWKDQLGTALWFTFSSLFFAHREAVNSNLTRAVVVTWLCLVFVLSSSYTASLTSMLTVPRLEPKVTDVEWIRRTNASVGCDGDSFVKTYLRNVIELQNIKNISNQDDYPSEFQSGNIIAAFLELPYQKVFLKEHCNDYTVVGPTYRFGGLGFVFQKGSPIARDFSKAILTLSENGKLKSLEDEWFGSSMDCSSSEESLETESLRFESFWGLYLISGTTSTLCLLIFLMRPNQKNAARNNRGIINTVVELTRLSQTRRSMRRAPTFSNVSSSSQWALVSPSDPSGHFDTSPPDEVGILLKD